MTFASWHFLLSIKEQIDAGESNHRFTVKITNSAEDYIFYADAPELVSDEFQALSKSGWIESYSDKIVFSEGWRVHFPLYAFQITPQGLDVLKNPPIEKFVAIYELEEYIKNNPSPRLTE